MRLPAQLLDFHLQDFASAALALKVLFDTHERKRETIRLRLHGGARHQEAQGPARDGELCVRLLQLHRGLLRPCLRALQVCAQDRKILVHLSDIKPHRGSHPPTDTADALLRMGHQFGAHIRHQIDALVNSQPFGAVIVPQRPVQHLGEMLHA